MAGTEGLDPSFAQKLDALMAAAPKHVGIASGFRSHDQQQALWNKSDKTGKMVAAPGHSHHEQGTAADLQFADAETKQWVHAHAADYGLYFPMSWEDWHIEPAGSRKDPQAYTTPPDGVPATDQIGGYFDMILGRNPAGDVGQMADTLIGGTPTTDPSAPAAGTAPTGGKPGYQQAYQYVIGAGGTPEEARMLAAFAGPESGYNAGAVSKPNTDGTIDRGLFQINSIHKQYDPSRLLDPAYNAKAALDIYRSQGPKAWTTYTSGAYKPYLPKAS